MGFIKLEVVKTISIKLERSSLVCKSKALRKNIDLVGEDGQKL